MNQPNCCNNYTRSRLLRDAAAQAGQGLPSIEPGMPLPAGTGLTRRRFLAGATGLALSVYGASRLPISAFDAGIAQAAQSNRVIVSVFLDGGADALSILAPTGHPRYFELRPNLAIDPVGATVFSEDPSFSWHPAAAALGTLHAEGKVTVLPAVGYDSPNQSHFTSRHFWEVGALDTGGTTGWMGRYLDLVGSEDNPLQGLSLSDSLSPAMATVNRPVAAVDDVTGYDLWSWVDDPIDQELFRSFKRFGSFASDSSALRQARRAIGSTSAVRESIEGFGEFTPPVEYPDSYLARQLSGLCALLGAGLPLHCVSVSADGAYDTHSDQMNGLAKNLQTTCDSIYSFQRDLESRGLQDRVLMQVWSEFGRRPEENGSAGTDHGAAGTAFIIGSRAEGRMIGEFPGLTSLDEQENLRHTSDFRSMYCSLLEQWLDHEAGPIIPSAAKFARPKLVRS